MPATWRMILALKNRRKKKKNTKQRLSISVIMYTRLLNTRYVNAYLHMRVYVYLYVHRACISAGLAVYSCTPCTNLPRECDRGNKLNLRLRSEVHTSKRRTCICIHTSGVYECIQTLHSPVCVYTIYNAPLYIIYTYTRRPQASYEQLDFNVANFVPRRYFRE